jgi:hypothetical protein
MPSKGNMRRRGRPSKGRLGVQSGDAQFAQSHESASRADVTFPREDLSHKPPVRLLTVSVPRNLLNLVTWLQCQVTSTFTTSTTVGTPFAKPFYLSSTPISSQVAQLFDQYSIYAVKSNFVFSNDTSGVAIAPTITTVVDFDGQSFLTPPTTAGVLNQYSTSLTSVLALGKSHERFIKPCCASALFNASGSGFTAYATERLWVDSGNASVPFYGLLGVVEITQAIGTITNVDSYVICCRNNN